MDIIITPDGDVRFIYNDDAAELLNAGKATVTRASHVEPYAGRGWYADMRPSGGPVLFANGEFPGTLGDGIGFGTRAEALAAEVAWLQKNRGL